VRERKGECHHTFPLAPFLSSTGSGRGGSRRSSDPAPASYNDGASTHLITPLPRGGSGAGGEGGPQCRRGVGGEGRPHLPPSPLPLPHCGRGRGGCHHTFPLAPFLSSTGSGRGGSRRSSDPAPASYNNGASIRSPLSRSAGAGLGVRVARSAGEGLGVRAALTFPPAPFLSHAAGEEGGDVTTPSPWPPFLSPTKRGRENVGAREKERWKPEFDPILSERWETWGLARKNAGNPSRHSHTGTVRAQ